MQRVLHSLYASLGFIMLSLLTATGSWAAPITTAIDLNGFYADQSITVSSDGGSATMEEDAFLSVVFLSNDPTLGDPGIALSGQPLSLSFDFLFSVAPGGDDELYARVFNGSNGALLNEWSTATSQSGTVSWDLNGIDASITTLGLEFQLRSWDSDIGSIVGLSNVTLTSESAAPVPEPSTLLLFATGTLAIAAFGRNRKIS